MQREKVELEKNIRDIMDNNEKCKAIINNLQLEKKEMDGLKMELQMLKEARDHDLQQIQNNIDSASETQSKISDERDVYKSQMTDLQQQLQATSADLKLSQSDYQRLLSSYDNLQKALEGMQCEHDSEITLLQEQRKHAEDVLKDSHDANIVALQELN